MCLQRYCKGINYYAKSDIIVVGDDIQSEINAAQDLGIDAVLYDKFNLYRHETAVLKIADFKELSTLLYN